jgi:hypothetical protein
MGAALNTLLVVKTVLSVISATLCSVSPPRSSPCFEAQITYGIYILINPNAYQELWAESVMRRCVVGYEHGYMLITICV